MTEPKQSFTEEVQKEAEERYKPFYNQSSYDENSLPRTSFIEGANVALSILSRKSEGREFWIDKGYVYSTKLISGNKYTAYSLESDIDAFVLKTSDKVHVIEHSALVAERARNAELEATEHFFKKKAEKLESENKELRLEIERLKNGKS